MRVGAEADAIYERFKGRPGSEHIASANAINTLLWALRRWPPGRVLEIGTGIGTLTQAILEALPEAVVTATEPNEFCADELATNLGDKRSRVDLHTTFADVPSGARFDLIVVDGGNPAPYAHQLAPGGVVFVEGDRAPQREAIVDGGRPVAAANIVSTRRATPGGPTLPDQVWEGGCWIFKFEPSPIDRIRLRARHLWDGRLVYRRRKLKARLRSREVRGSE